MAERYRTLEGVEYDLSTLSDEEKKSYGWLVKESEAASSFLEFQNRTAHGIIEAAKKKDGTSWSKNFLYQIQLDLLARISIRSGECKRDISDKLVEE